LMDECGSPSHQPSISHLATAATRTQAKHPSSIISQPVDRPPCASPHLRSERVRSTVFPATATAPRSEPLLLCVRAHNTQPKSSCVALVRRRPPWQNGSGLRRCQPEHAQELLGL
jgi:hypothetical protein